MNSQQLILTFISAILFTLFVVYFLKTIFIFRKANRYFYFSLATLGGSIFAFYALKLCEPAAPLTVLACHRLRLAGLMLCVTAWIYCIYDIYYPQSRLPRFFLGFSLLTAVTIPTNLFLSLPVTRFEINLGGFPTSYQLATTRLAYSLFAAGLMLFFLYSAVRIVRDRKRRTVKKIYGLLIFVPGVLAGVNDFSVSHGLFHNLMITEFVIVIFALVIFSYFLSERNLDYQALQNMNSRLHEEVRSRTAELERANAQLQKNATTDSLTGLANLRYLEKRLQEEEARLQRGLLGKLVIIFLDLDNFKYYNDHFGHQAGDHLLKAFAGLLRDNFRHIDCVIRYGGDEFLVLLPAANEDEAVKSVQRLFAAMAAQDYLKPVLAAFLNREVAIPADQRLSFSLGIARYRKGLSLSEVILEADRAMYLAKNRGKNQFVLGMGSDTDDLAVRLCP